MSRLKECELCLIWKFHGEFSPKTRSADGLQSKCKVCRRMIARETKSTRSAWSVTDTLAELYAHTPCTDCRQVFPFHKLSFDHLDRSLKSFKIADNGGDVATPQTMAAKFAEIAKCEPVCLHCHADRTKAQLEEITRDKLAEAHAYLWMVRSRNWRHYD